MSDEALIEAIARAIRSHRAECYSEGGDRFGWQCLICGEEIAAIHRSIEVAEQDALSHSARAVVEHLGLRWEIGVGDQRDPSYTPPRRLVSQWQEVEP